MNGNANELYLLSIFFFQLCMAGRAWKTVIHCNTSNAKKKINAMWLKVFHITALRMEKKFWMTQKKKWIAISTNRWISKFTILWPMRHYVSKDIGIPQRISIYWYVGLFSLCSSATEPNCSQAITTTTKNRSEMKAQSCSLFPIRSLTDLQDN